MYPYLRMVKELWKSRRMPKIGLFQTHISHHRILLGDIDPWGELNNGRTLTLFDLGRVGLATRSGFVGVLRQKRWGMTVAGNTTRYRKRLTLFSRVEMRTHLLGWDERFLYLEQSLWKGEECCSHLLVRGGLVRSNGEGPKLVRPAELAEACGFAPESPALPVWVQAWIAADHDRPWPPKM